MKDVAHDRDVRRVKRVIHFAAGMLQMEFLPRAKHIGAEIDEAHAFGVRETFETGLAAAGP